MNGISGSEEEITEAERRVSCERHTHPKASLQSQWRPHTASALSWHPNLEAMYTKACESAKEHCYCWDSARSPTVTKTHALGMKLLWVTSLCCLNATEPHLQLVAKEQHVHG